jgi:hypothetical protein
MVYFPSVPKISGKSKALDGMSLYVTGTVMKNRVPRKLTIIKSSKEFKNITHGDYKKHVY